MARHNQALVISRNIGVAIESSLEERNERKRLYSIVRIN